MNCQKPHDGILPELGIAAATYVSKELFFFDITNLSASERHNIRVEQLQQGHALAYPTSHSVNVYLEGEEAVVAIYREG